jgi:hypothetical protein
VTFVATDLSRFASLVTSSPFPYHVIAVFATRFRYAIVVTVGASPRPCFFGLDPADTTDR